LEFLFILVGRFTLLNAVNEAVAKANVDFGLRRLGDRPITEGQTAAHFEVNRATLDGVSHGLRLLLEGVGRLLQDGCD